MWENEIIADIKKGMEEPPEVASQPLNDLLCLPSYQAAYRACGIYEREISAHPYKDKKHVWCMAVKQTMLEREQIGKSTEEA